MTKIIFFIGGFFKGKQLLCYSVPSVASKNAFMKVQPLLIVSLIILKADTFSYF